MNCRATVPEEAGTVTVNAGLVDGLRAGMILLHLKSWRRFRITTVTEDYTAVAAENRDIRFPPEPSDLIAAGDDFSTRRPEVRKRR